MSHVPSPEPTHTSGPVDLCYLSDQVHDLVFRQLLMLCVSTELQIRNRSVTL